MAAINSSDISLSDIVRIVSSLSDICASSIGPMCEKTLFTTSTGSVLFVTNGIDIVNALQFSHPVARFVVNSLQHAHSVTGDGSKLFILYITEFTRSVEQQVNTSSQTNGAHFRENLRRITQGLKNFKHLIMEFEFSNHLYPLSSINSSNFLLSCCHLKQVCKSVLLSSLSDKESTYLSSLLIDFLSSGVECTDSLHRVIDFTIKHFDVLVHKDIGHSYSSSKVLPGILVPCEGTLSLDLLSSKEEILSVVLQSFLTSDGDAETTETTFTITKFYEFNSLVSFQYHQCEAFIKQCKLNNVKLVCCCQEIPKFAETLFQQHGINTISYLPEEFCEYFQTIAQKQPLSCIRDSLCDSSLLSIGLHNRTVVNGSTYLQMTLSCPLLVNVSSSLILTAPTLGMVHSSSQQIFKCLKSLKMCYETFQILPFNHENITNENLTPPTSSSKIFTLPAMRFQTKMLQYCQERTFKNISHNNNNDDDGNIPWEILDDTFRCVCRKVCTSQKFSPIQIQNCLPEHDEIKMNNSNSQEFYKEGSWLPLYTEFYILHASLQVVIQLLNMDQIVKVKSIKQNV